MLPVCMPKTSEIFKYRLRYTLPTGTAHVVRALTGHIQYTYVHTVEEDLEVCFARSYYNNLYSLRFPLPQYWTHYWTDMSSLSKNETHCYFRFKSNLWDPPHTMKQSTYISCGILERATYRRRLGSHQWRASCDREKDCSDLDIQLPLQTINAELLSSGSNKWSHSTSTMNKVGMYETMRRRLALVSHVYTMCDV